MTKAIIAGGRDYHIGPKQRRWLDGVHAVIGITEVVSGAALGADEGGETWAIFRGIIVTQFHADWKTHGKSAGPKRNIQMADYLTPQDIVILFPGGPGTMSMRNTALARKLRVIQYADLESIK